MQSWGRNQSQLVVLCRDCSFLHLEVSLTARCTSALSLVCLDCVLACRGGNPSVSLPAVHPRLFRALGDRARLCPLGGMFSRREPSRMDLSGEGHSVCWRVSTLLCQGYLRISASRVPTAWRPWLCPAKALARLRLLWGLGHL